MKIEVAPTNGKHSDKKICFCQFFEAESNAKDAFRSGKLTEAGFHCKKTPNRFAHTDAAPSVHTSNAALSRKAE
jgi:hypothetical protein